MDVSIPFAFLCLLVYVFIGEAMDYYNEIKNELVVNEITKRVKDYSKNIIDK